MNNYTSDELFHFVGRKNPLNHDQNYETLLQVLRSGWVSAPPHRPGWGPITMRVDLSRTLESGELVQPAMTCFCDIPKEALGVHVSKYGFFGLSFKREFLVRAGARPVTYIPMSKTDQNSVYGLHLLRDIEAKYRSYRTHLAAPLAKSDFARGFESQATTADETVRALSGLLEKDFIAFIKPFSADLPLDHSENYYMEREWRRLGNVEATAKTVHRVIVKAGYESRVSDDLPGFAHLVHRLP